MSLDDRITKTEHDVRTPVFTQTGASSYPELDQWKQVGEEEAQLAYEMTLRNELSGGTPVVRDFEKTWREWIGSKYAITVGNGSISLYSAYFGLGVGPGDEVICPTYTWICTLSGAIMLGARPVFCDVDPESMLLDPADVKKRITDKTKAIVAVHLWGNVCDMDALMEISRETGVPVLEDCSHAHGAMYRERHVGTMGRVACWSLQGSKPVSAGEGGVLATDDLELFERACLLGQVNRLGGVDLATERYESLQPFGIGMKTRAHPIGIGIADVQLKKLPALNARRAAFIEAVEAGLADAPGLRPIRIHDGATRGGYYGFPIHHDPNESGITTSEYIEGLKAEGLPANSNPYPLLHTLSIFSEGFDLFTENRCGLSQDYPGYEEDDFPAALEMTRNLVFLPALSAPVDGAAGRVLEAIRKAAARICK